MEGNDVEPFPWIRFVEDADDDRCGTFEAGDSNPRTDVSSLIRSVVVETSEESSQGSVDERRFDG